MLDVTKQIILKYFFSAVTMFCNYCDAFIASVNQRSWNLPEETAIS